MKKILTLLIAFGFTLQAAAQKNEYTQAILLQADKMGRAFITKDYEAFIKYSHPTTVVMMGGEENMLEYIKTNFGQIEAEGVTFLNVNFGAPTEIIPVQNKDLNILELQCTLPQMVEMKVPGGQLTASTTLIAVSRDNGLNWYFIDTSGNDIITMRKIIPTLSPDIVLPEQHEPSFIADEPAEKKP